MSRRGNSTRVYIGNLPEDVSQSEVEQLFYKFGRIREIDIKYARSIYGTTYAFLEYDDSRDAEEAVERRNGYKFGRTRLRVEFTGDRRPKRNRNKSHGPLKRTSFRVLVSGLPPDSSWQDLKDHMRKVGPVGYANIENRVGIVEYEYREDMERSIRKLDKSQFENIFHRCEIRVRPDKNSSYYRDRSYSRVYRSKHSRSRSRSSRRSPAYSYSNSRSRRSYSRHGSSNISVNRRDKSVHESHKRGHSNSEKRYSKSHSLSGSQHSARHNSNNRNSIEARNSNSVSHSFYSHKSSAHGSESRKSSSNRSYSHKSEPHVSDNATQLKNNRSESNRSGSHRSIENQIDYKRSDSRNSNINQLDKNHSHISSENFNFSSHEDIIPDYDYNLNSNKNNFNNDFDININKKESYSPTEEATKVEA